MKIAQHYCIYNLLSCRLESRFRGYQHGKTRRPSDRDPAPAISRAGAAQVAGRRMAPPPLPRRRGRRRGVRRDRAARARRPAGGHPPPLSLDQGADQHRLPDEPGADPQPGPLGRQPGVPSHGRSDQRGCPRASSPPSRPRGIRAVNPSMGFPMEMDRVPRQDLGRLPQAGRRGGGARADGHPPQRHPPEVRQLHPPGARS